MPRDSLIPCLVCGRQLDNVDDESCNCPDGADCFSTHGHYGSRLFDPMNGEYLEINVCSDCLRTAVDSNRVLICRDWKHVLAGGVIVGTTAAPRAPVHWRTDMPSSDDVLRVDSRDEWEVIKDKVSLFRHLSEEEVIRFIENPWYDEPV